MAIMDCLLPLQCEFQFNDYIQKDCLIHLRAILFSSVYNKCNDTHRDHRHKLMDIERRTNIVKNAQMLRILKTKTKVKYIKSPFLESFLKLDVSISTVLIIKN